MGQYEQNVDLNDIYCLFNYSQPEYSQFLSFHQQISAQILQNPPLEGNQQLEIKQDEITQDKKCEGTSQSTSPNIFSFRPRLKVLGLDIGVEKRYKLIRQGSKDDTVELNINFKTIIYNFLKQSILAKELEPEEQSKVMQFRNRSPSFKSLILLCDKKNKNSRISNILTKFVESSLIIIKIMESRCKFMTKLQMIKFIEILKCNVNGSGKIVKWKESNK